jgi:hypothetical protein
MDAWWEALVAPERWVSANEGLFGFNNKSSGPEFAYIGSLLAGSRSGLESAPWLLRGVDAVQLAGQPDVDTQGQRRTRRRGDCPVIKWNGAPPVGLEILLAQAHGRRLQHSVVGVLGNHRSETLTICVLTWTALPSSTIPMRTVSAIRRASCS